MKIKFKYIVIALIGVLLASCELAQTSENISKITYYPVIKLKGQQWSTVLQGSAYTDPGANVFEGETEIKFASVTGTVNTSVPGVYIITYVSEPNKDGFSSQEYRYIGVIAPAVAGSAIDLSGNYKRTAGDQGISVVTKIANNFYYADNVGGVKTTNPSLGVYFYHYDVGKLGVPYQLTPGNAFECTNGSVVVGVSYSWVVINPGYGTALRTFIKQP